MKNPKYIEGVIEIIGVDRYIEMLIHIEAKELFDANAVLRGCGLGITQRVILLKKIAKHELGMDILPHFTIEEKP